MKLQRSAGVLTPLFSVYSKNSCGVGEFADVPVLADWCKTAGFRILQFLPLNDMGFNFRPYDSESSIALEPMHLSLDGLSHVPISAFKQEIESLKQKFNTRGDFYDTQIKKAKLELLKKIFEKRLASGEKDFKHYVKAQEKWLESYAMYRVLKQRFGGASWMDWPEEFRLKKPEAMKGLKVGEGVEIEFQKWLQWQAYEQFSKAHKLAKKKGVLLMGDIPFLVSRDSADVWANPEYFKLELSAGAPPDLYFAAGQEWGMPPYRWEAIEQDNYDYLAQKLKYAENFYDLFRIDHFIGVFRVWTFRLGLPEEERKKTGAFDPADESIWEAHGRKIVEAMLRSSSMKPCAEDLGCVPKCSEKVLEDYQIPGIDVQRWMRHWETTGEYKTSEEFRSLAMAVISTHDTTPLDVWWKWEAGDPSDRQKFWESIGLPGPYDAEPTPRLVRACFEAISKTRSIFSIQLLQDWLLLAGVFKDVRQDYRINTPGVVHENHWRLRSPLSLEELCHLPANQDFFNLNKKSRRIN